jgi:hypothetical protein
LGGAEAVGETALSVQVFKKHFSRVEVLIIIYLRFGANLTPPPVLLTILF